jgi:hypothetical protein
MLAITFSNNAAREMRVWTLSWLKKVYFGDSEKVEDLLEITSMNPERMKEKRSADRRHPLQLLDFQVKTIDSFMTSVFKASAIDFGYNPI